MRTFFSLVFYAVVTVLSVIAGNAVGQATGSFVVGVLVFLIADVVFTVALVMILGAIINMLDISPQPQTYVRRSYSSSSVGSTEDAIEAIAQRRREKEQALASGKTATEFDAEEAARTKQREAEAKGAQLKRLSDVAATEEPLRWE